MVINCEKCGAFLELDQPHPYNAGLGNQGFMYNESGRHTLVWDSYDPHYTALVGPTHPWALSRESQRILEDALLPSPDDTAWSFSASARCVECGESISGPMPSTKEYLVLPGSLVTSLGGPQLDVAIKVEEL